MYRKTTLRRMQPVTRRYARNLNSLQGILKRLQNLTQDIARLEADSTALYNRNKADRARQKDNDAHLASCIEKADPANLDEFMSDYFNQQEAGHEL